MNIEQIAKTMTREEFINCLRGSCNTELFYNGRAIDCPRRIGLKDKNGICHAEMECHECWLNSIKDVKFKGEDIAKYFTWGVFKAITENPKLKFKRLSDGLIFSGDNEHFIWEPGHEHLSPNDEWVLIQEPKPVDIKEAVKAYTEGKTIYCKVGGTKFVYADYKGNFYIQMICNTGEGLGPAEILNGTWYVEG